MFFFSTLVALFVFSCKSDVASNQNATTATSSSTPAGQETTYQPSAQTSLKILLPDTVAAKGETICLDVKAAEFTNIVSIQHSINWDAKVLKFSKLQNFKLVQLNQANFGLTQVKEGKLGISWYDAGVKGISQPDGQVLYQICFEVIGAAGASSPIRISSDPVTIEVSNSESRILGIPTGKGKITVK